MPFIVKHYSSIRGRHTLHNKTSLGFLRLCGVTGDQSDNQIVPILYLSPVYTGGQSIKKKHEQKIPLSISDNVSVFDTVNICPFPTSVSCLMLL